MNVTSTSIAVALALAVATGFFLISSPSTLFDSASSQSVLNLDQTASTTVTTTSSMEPVSEVPTELTITDTVIGSGVEATPGSTVTVNYVGALTDGTVFDASANHGQPFAFQLGAGQVIRGWDEGIVGMKVGGKRTLIIPASLAYGNQAVGGVIPANATLMFEVELLGVQ